MNKIFILLALLLLSCASKQNYKSTGATGNTRTKSVEMIDRNTYLLTESSSNSSYGYTQDNPVKVGGASTSEGPLNERRFLNALFGPNNKKMMYYRLGSCCPFKTPNGFSDTGMLDKYRMAEIGSKDSVDIFINMYDEGDLFIPVGLTAMEKR